MIMKFMEKGGAGGKLQQQKARVNQRRTGQKRQDAAQDAHDDHADACCDKYRFYHL